MQSILPALKSAGMYAWFVEQSQRSLLWALIAGICVTAVMQSGTAVIAMTMGLSSMGAVGADVGIAIVLGANAGTCLTALIASVGGSRAGKWVAWSHVILNVGGAVLFFPLIPLLEQFSSWLTPHPAGQIAHTQTVYNLACSLLALPLCYLPAIRSLSPVKS
jgi:phosphate:Na+ symporter